MKNVKIILGVIVLSGVLILSCEEDRIEGTGTITTEIIEVPDFSGIRLEGVSDVYIRHGAEQKVEATGHPNIINRIQTDVVNGIWHMELESGSYGSYELSFDLTILSLEEVINIGTGNVIINSFTHQPEIEVVLEGTGDYRGFELTVEDAVVVIRGTGNCELTANGSLEVDIEGSGNVYYKGSPSIESNISGSGAVIDSN